jgi:shikimate kinase
MPASPRTDRVHRDRGPHLLVIGMMGSGKTTMGRRLAKRLGRPFIDTDAMVVERVGMSIPEFFDAHGEAAFRAAESAVLAELVDADEPTVIAVAGGAVLAETNRPLLQRGGTVIWLRATPETIVERIGHGRGRPLLRDDPEGRIRAYDQARRPIYTDLADIVVDVDGRSPGQVIGACLALIS